MFISFSDYKKNKNKKNIQTKKTPKNYKKQTTNNNKKKNEKKHTQKQLLKTSNRKPTTNTNNYKTIKQTHKQKLRGVARPSSLHPNKPFYEEWHVLLAPTPTNHFTKSGTSF